MPDSMADVLLIKFRISVFGVSKQWMSYSCKVSTNLVSTACDQLNFQKSYFPLLPRGRYFVSIGRESLNSCLLAITLFVFYLCADNP